MMTHAVMLWELAEGFLAHLPSLKMHEAAGVNDTKKLYCMYRRMAGEPLLSCL